MTRAPFDWKVTLHARDGSEEEAQRLARNAEEGLR